MIVEFALSVSLLAPPVGSPVAPPVVPAQFSEPVQQVVTYPPEGEIRFLTGLPLLEFTQDAFDREFASAAYFGAFAVTKDGGYGYATGSNSPQAARDIAVQECLKQGPVCMIYAEILPQGFAPLAEGQVSLADEPAQFFTRPDPAWGAFRAMAVSEDGAYSVVWNHDTREAAEAAAIAECSQQLIGDLPQLRQMPCVLLPFK